MLPGNNHFIFLALDLWLKAILTIMLVCSFPVCPTKYPSGQIFVLLVQISGFLIVHNLWGYLSIKHFIASFHLPRCLVRQGRPNSVVNILSWASYIKVKIPVCSTNKNIGLPCRPEFFKIQMKLQTNIFIIFLSLAYIIVNGFSLYIWSEDVGFNL